MEESNQQQNFQIAPVQVKIQNQDTQKIFNDFKGSLKLLQRRTKERFSQLLDYNNSITKQIGLSNLGVGRNYGLD